jgi:sec-independent protein translocase protein TatC
VGIGFVFAADLIEIIKNRPPASRIDWNIFAPSDAVRIYLQFAFVIGLIFTSPFALLQLWKFVSPGLQPEERKITISFIPAAVLLFLLGISFGYFIVFPMIFLFLSNVAVSLQVTETYGIAEFFGFMFNYST